MLHRILCTLNLNFYLLSIINNKYDKIAFSDQFRTYKHVAAGLQAADETC